MHMYVHLCTFCLRQLNVRLKLKRGVEKSKKRFQIECDVRCAMCDGRVVHYGINIFTSNIQCIQCVQCYYKIYNTH